VSGNRDLATVEIEFTPLGGSTVIRGQWIDDHLVVRLGFFLGRHNRFRIRRPAVLTDVLFRFDGRISIKVRLPVCNPLHNHSPSGL